MSTTPGRLHPQLLRRPGTRWWQAPTSLLLVGLGYGVLSVGLALFEVGFYTGFGSYMGVQADGSWGGQAPVLYAVVRQLALVGLVLVAACWAYSVRPGWLVSVATRVRPRVLLAALPAALVAGAGSWLLARGTGTAPTPADPATVHAVTNPVAWVAIALLLVLATALLDEIAFRGWVAQAVGSLVAGERAAVVLGGLASAAAYAWWHRTDSATGVVCAGLVGVVLVAVATATGGLETTFAVSAGLTGGLLLPYAARYGLDVAFAPRAVAWTDVVVAVVAGAVAVALARRVGAERRGLPEGEQRGLSDLRDARGVR